MISHLLDQAGEEHGVKSVRWLQRVQDRLQRWTVSVLHGLRASHGYSYTATATRLQLHGYSYTATATRLQLHGYRATQIYSYTATATRLCSFMATELHSYISVPARLGKGQGAKEIGHNLARERPKFGHNLVRKRHKIFYAWTTKIWSCEWLMKTWAQICKHFTSIFTSAVWKHKNSNNIL